MSESLHLFGSLCLDIFLEFVQAFFHDFLNAHDMLGSYFFFSFDHNQVAAIHRKSDRLANRLAQPVVQLTFQALTFGNDWLKTAGNLLIVGSVKRFDFCIEFAHLAVALLFDLSNLIIQLETQFVFRNADFLLDAVQRFLASILVHGCNNVLGKIEYAVKVSARDVQQQTQI